MVILDGQPDQQLRATFGRQMSALQLAANSRSFASLRMTTH
jgi:hypothetical protein